MSNLFVFFSKTLCPRSIPEFPWSWGVWPMLSPTIYICTPKSGPPPLGQHLGWGEAICVQLGPYQVPQPPQGLHLYPIKSENPKCWKHQTDTHNRAQHPRAEENMCGNGFMPPEDVRLSQGPSVYGY